MSRRRSLSLICLLPPVLAALGCREPALPPPEKEIEARRGWTQTGEASYYANKFRGRRTASGQRYDPRLLSAAHRTLPFGCVVRVTNLENGRAVTVSINDRGPWKRGRIIDLSRAAAAKLDMIRTGVARVKIEVLK